MYALMLRLAVLAMVALNAVSTAQADEFSEVDPGCPGLADNLRSVWMAADWIHQAQTAGLVIVDGRVRVIAEIDPEDSLIPEVPGVVQGRYFQFVQVLVAPADLCALASVPGVVAVRSPALPVQGPNPG